MIERRFIRSGLLAVLVATATLGCQKDRAPRAAAPADREVERSVIVRATTQPGAAVEGAGFDDGEPQRIRVIVDDRTDPLRAAPAPVPSLEPFVGQPCRVQIRRDALGLAAPAPLPPLAEGVGGRPAYVDGTLAQANGEGVLVQGDRRAYWLPWSSVLLIELGTASGAAQ